MMHASLRRKNGFTLVELLIVVCIVAILAAILFPVFSRARENARRSSCQSNLKQISMAVMQYVQDYDEKFPMGEIYPVQPTDKACAAAAAAEFTPKFKTLALTSTTTSSQNMLTWMSVIYDYTKSTQIYMCPSGPSLADGANWSASWRGVSGFGYAYNPLIFQNWIWDAVEITGGKDSIDASCNILKPSIASGALAASRLTAPASVTMLADRGQTSRESLDCVDPVGKSHYCSCSHGGTAQNSNVTGWLNGEDDLSASSVAGQGTNPARRHFEGGNHLFADGHVKWLSHSSFMAAKPGILNAGVS